VPKEKSNFKGKEASNFRSIGANFVLGASNDASSNQFISPNEPKNSKIGISEDSVTTSLNFDSSSPSKK
jgi:hypothetical protein